MDTLPWDCSLKDVSVFTVIDDRARYVLDPVVVRSMLAKQQEGLGVTVHTDNIVLSFSKKQVMRDRGREG